MSVLLPLDEIAETGLRMDTDFRLYNRDLSAYITVGTGGFTVTGTFTASGFASGFTVQASTNIAKGDIVYISSTTAAGVPIVAVADADAAGKAGVFVVTDTTILSGASGTVALSGLSAATLNTNAGVVGDPVYLTTTGTTTNTWTLTAPTAADAIVQVIGRINVQSATVGQIAYNLFPDVQKIGSNELQPGAINGQIIQDTKTLGFGTPGTDVVFTADGTDLVVTATGDVVLADSVELAVGTGKDLKISHDGTNTSFVGANGDIIIDNTDVNDVIALRVGTDTNATGVEFRNNSDAVMWVVSPSSATAGTLKGLDGSAIVLGAGNDDNIAHDGTLTTWTHTTGSLLFDNTDVNDPTIFRLGTDTSATSVVVKNDSDAALFTMDGAGTLTFGAAAAKIVVQDAAGGALTIEDSAGNDFLVIDTAAVDGITLGNATTNPVLTVLGTGGTDVSAGTLTAGAGTFSGTLAMLDGSRLQMAGAGTGSGDLIQVIGPDSTHGHATYVYEATVAPAAIETALFTLPAESFVVSAQANIETALTGGGTTVTASIGITGDVDLYGTFGAPTDVLTQNGKLNYAGSGNPPGAGAGLGTFNKSTVAIKLIGAATGGTAAGDTALTAGTVKVRIIYQTLLPMANA